jgi:toxin ParE1/3/4
MPRRRAITFAESAVGDLDEIRTWYAEQQVPGVGEKLLGEIVSRIERLLRIHESDRAISSG